MEPSATEPLVTLAVLEWDRLCFSIRLQNCSTEGDM